MENKDLIALFKEHIDVETSKRAGDAIPKFMAHHPHKDGYFFFGTKSLSFPENKHRIGNIGKPQNKDGHILVPCKVQNSNKKNACSVCVSRLM